MKVPINPIVEMALKQPDDENSISFKIRKLSDYCVEFKRLIRNMETQEPTSYTRTRLKFLIPEIEKLGKEVKEWKDNCEYKLVSI